jgi:peptide chain release factor 2
VTRQIAQLEAEAAEPGFWSDPEAARAKMARLASLRAPLERLAQVERRCADLEALLELAEQAPDDPELAAEAAAALPAAEAEVQALETLVLLHGPYDRGDAIVSIHPGAGGTESQDWAEMLLRMYRRWAEARGFTFELLDLLEGEEAGIKAATFSVRGPGAYGLLQSEKGVHRLVRISPFDASGRRHTSFAAVDVLPELPESEIEIRPEDLEIDRFRASGHGGQHVNRTESAVRVRHKPTGIVVTCQNERSQHSNLETALTILRGRLAALRAEEREREVAQLRGPQGEIAFGSQIRSYVFAPYQLVKDHRTGVETGNVQAVMDGEIDPFITAYLVQRRRQAAPEAAAR